MPTCNNLVKPLSREPYAKWCPRPGFGSVCSRGTYVCCRNTCGNTCSHNCLLLFSSFLRICPSGDLVGRPDTMEASALRSLHGDEKNTVKCQLQHTLQQRAMTIVVPVPCSHIVLGGGFGVHWGAIRSVSWFRKTPLNTGVMDWCYCHPHTIYDISAF